jgi:hypothetical protein
MTQPVRLGEITCPSGELVVVDGGHLRLWSGDRSPLELDRSALGRSPDPEVDGDVPHRELVRRAARGGGGEFWMCSVPAVAVAGLPRGKLLEVVADQVGSVGGADQVGSVGGADVVGSVGGADVVGSVRFVEDGWASLRVVCSHAPVVRSRTLGEVGVDWARIAFADADALAAWRHDEPIDGRADIAFWGAAEEKAARAFAAPLLETPGEEGVHGWTDLPLAEAEHRATELRRWRDANAVPRLMVDFRPHSHHWQVMRGVRASSTDSGMVEVGGAWLLFARTGWGDGYFPVIADFDAEGGLVAVRVQLLESDDELPEE